MESIKIHLLLIMLAAFSFAHSREENSSPPPFEKIYVTPYEIFTTPYGSYYRNPSGENEQVASISTDCEGTYIIMINRQCPTCGRCSRGKVPAEGLCCPINEKYDIPFIWGPSYK